MVFYCGITNGLSELMATLAGSNGQSLLRLRSFRIEYSPNDFADWVAGEVFRHPTPILEELQITLYAYYEPISVHPIFSLPAPKLSRVSIDARYPIEPLISFNQPVKSLHLDLCAPFPDHSFLQNLVYLSIINSEPSIRSNGQDIILPSLRDLAIRSCRFGIVIKAPKLDILRIFEAFDGGLDLSSIPPFPSIRKFHWDCAREKGKFEAFLIFIGRHPLLEEIGIVHWDSEKVKTFISLIRDDIRYSKFKLKGYEAPIEALASWSAPFPYESHQIEMDT